MRTKRISTMAGVFLAATAAGCEMSGVNTDELGEMATSPSALSATLPNNQPFRNATGKSASFSTAGSIDLAGSFFQRLGTNGR